MTRDVCPALPVSSLSSSSMIRFSMVRSCRYASVRKLPEPHAESPMVMEATLSCSLARAYLRFAAVLSPSASCSSSHSSSRKSGLRQRSMFSTLV